MMRKDSNCGNSDVLLLLLLLLVRSKISETEKQNFYIDFLDLKQRGKTSYEPIEGKIYVIDCVLLKRKEGKALICYKS